MGLFDYSNPDDMAYMALASGLLGGKGNLGSILGKSLMGSQGAYQSAQESKNRTGLANSQTSHMQAVLQQMEEERKKRQAIVGAARDSMMSPEIVAAQGGPTLDNAAKIPTAQPQLNQNAFIQKMFQIDPMLGIDTQSKLAKQAPKLESFKPGEVGGYMDPTGKFKQVVSVPDRADKPPSAVQEYEYAQKQGYTGGFNDWLLAQKKAGASSVSVNTGEKGFKNELQLKQDFRQEPIYKDYQDMQSAYKQIKAGIAQGTPVGDLATATKIMKLLDPGSVVRESELGMAMAATGRMDRLKNYVQLQVSGNKLTPQQRDDFGKLADDLFDAAGQAYNQKHSEYEGIGKRYQLETSSLGPRHKSAKATQSIYDQADAIIGK